MCRGVLAVLALTVLSATFFVRGTVAAPIVPPVTPMALYGPSLEQVYYHHGRYYPYHYHNRYYAHRVYRHGHWHYY
jgi:hypothetical protein